MSGPEIIKSYRKAHCVKQTALADKAKVSRGVLSQIENGLHPITDKTAKRLAAVIGCEWWTLCSPPESVDPTPRPAQRASKRLSCRPAQVREIPRGFTEPEIWRLGIARANEIIQERKEAVYRTGRGIA